MESNLSAVWAKPKKEGVVNQVDQTQKKLNKLFEICNEKSEGDNFYIFAYCPITKYVTIKKRSYLGGVKRFKNGDKQLNGGISAFNRLIKEMENE